jgi:hypothetical protein
MRKYLAAGLAALTFAGTIAAGAASAQPYRSQPYRSRDYDRRHYRDDSGAAIAAGIAGLAVGAALANGGRGSYSNGYYYGPSRYAYEHYYGPRYYGPRHCRTREVWDSYYGGYVEQTRCW